MATKKNTKSNRQQTKKSLSVSRSKKKTVAAKSPKTTSRKAPPKKVAAKKRSPKKPALHVKQFKLRVWKDTFLIFQLQRPKKTAVKKSSKPSATIKNSQQKLAVGLIVAGLLGAVYFSTDIFRPSAPLTVYSPPVPAEITQTKPTTLSPKTFGEANPVKLTIPTLGINSSLVTVGKNPDNTLEVPTDAQAPAWYRLSPTPGELGPSIIVGHVDSPTGPAIFWKLNQLQRDQIIEIAREDNSVVKFKVTDVRQFEQNDFPTKEVYGNIDHAGLRLITCGGTFNRTTRSYSHNTVVFAELIP